MPLTTSGTSAGTIAGKDFWDEDTEEDWQPENPTARRKITCHWDDRLTITAALLGGVSRTGIIDTVTPVAAYPDAPWMVCKGVTPEGLGVRKTGTNGMVGYDFARLTVRYGKPDHDLGQTQDLGALGLDIASEIYSPPRDQPTFTWLDGTPVTPEATPGLSISVATFSRIRRNLGDINVPLILSLLDHVNDAVFEGAARGTVMFVGARPYRKITNLGAQNWDLELIFKFRSVPWNYFLRPKGNPPFQEIRYITSAGGVSANGPYLFGNLRALYQ